MKNIFSYPRKIETERLILKKTTLSDEKFVPEILKAVKNSIKIQKEFSPWSKEDNQETITGYIKLALKRWKTGNRYLYFIFDKKTGEFLGEISLHRFIKWNKTAEMGYWIKPSATKKGYCQESIKVMEKLAFERDLNRLVLKVDSLNKPSIRTAELAGYHLDGVLRQDSYISDLDILNDTNYYTKLKDEWRSK